MGLKGKADSYVVKSDVHFPTDLTLLWDAMRKIIILIARVSDIFNISDWRQSLYNLKQVKKLCRKVSNLKHSTSKNEEKQLDREELIKEAYQTYRELSKQYIKRTELTIENIRTGKINLSGISLFDSIKGLTLCNEVETYIMHANKQIDQIKRRVLDGEKIPHDEKSFSIFEEHVEWISKGKKGVPQELGLRLCILEDQFGFILHHEVMEKKTDDKVTIDMIWEAKVRYPQLNQCSFDKGFYSKNNKVMATELIENVIMPKKGRLNKEEKEEEGSANFKKARRKHSAIESAINGLNHTGLDKCRDKGLDGHKRYVALGITARNIFRLGAIIMKKEEATRKRKEKYRATQQENKRHKTAA